MKPVTAPSTPRVSRSQIPVSHGQRDQDGRTVSPTELTFLVEFVTADGQPYTVYPPPGAAGEPRSQFTFTVTRLHDNDLVLALPPYVS